MTRLDDSTGAPEATGARAERTASLPSFGRAGVIQLVLLIAAAVFVGWILATRWDDLRAAASLTPRLFILISLSSFLTFLVNGLELHVLTGRFSRHVPVGDAFVLGLMVSTLNYLPMKTGTLLNGLLLKSRYNVQLAEFGALVAGSSLIHLWAALGLAGAVLLARGALAGGALLLVTPTIVMGIAFVWGRSHTGGRFGDNGPRLVHALGRAVDGLGMILGDMRLLAIELVLNVALIALWAARTMWSLEALSIDAGFDSALVITGLSIAAARLSIIPGGIGFKEAGAAAGAAYAGFSATIGLASSIIDRAVMLIWLLVFGVPASVWMLRRGGVTLRGSGGRNEEA